MDALPLAFLGRYPLRKTRGMGLLRANDARKKTNRGTAAVGHIYSDYGLWGKKIDA